MAWIHPRAPEAKVFWFFSSEKNILNPFLWTNGAIALPRLDPTLSLMEFVTP